MEGGGETREGGGGVVEQEEELGVGDETKYEQEEAKKQYDEEYSDRVAGEARHICLMEGGGY